jgi:hypothetical protein
MGRPRIKLVLISLMVLIFALAPNARAWGWWWGVSVIVGGALCLASGGVALPVIAGTLAGATGTLKVGDSIYDDIVNSSSNPVGGSLVLQKANPASNPVAPFTDPGTPAPILSDLNAAHQHFADSVQYADGLRESCRRYYGAKFAGNTSAMALQAGYAREFLALEEQASTAGVQRFRSYIVGLRSVNPPSPNTLATASEYTTFRDSVRSNGLPQCVVDELNLLHTSPQEQLNIRAYIEATTDVEIQAFFANYPPQGVYAADLLDEAMNQWEGQPFGNAIPAEIQSQWTSPYQWDDGSTENGVGWITGGDLCFTTRFDVAGGGQDTITKVRASFGYVGGTTVSAGTPVKVFVWDDPNDDDNPNDCVLVATANGVTSSPNSDTLEHFPIPPASVSGRFYIGAVIAGPAGTYPGPMDTTAVVPGVAWLTGTNTIGAYTGVPFTGDKGLFKMSSIGFPCNWLLRAESGNPLIIYCTAKVNALGCTPAIHYSGSPSATAPSGFAVSCSSVRNNKPGLLFYSVFGQQSVPFQGGTLCVKPPVRRTPVVSSGGNPLPINDCSGFYAIDMNAFAQGLLGGAPLANLKVAGTIVDCQWWGRDPGFPPPNNTTLSDGLHYVVGP